jgi:hypothetical protein
VAWLFLARFTVRIRCKNQQGKIEKMSSLVKKGTLKVVDKEGGSAKEISVIKKKPSTLPWENMKDALRASQELNRLQL